MEFLGINFVHTELLTTGTDDQAGTSTQSPLWMKSGVYLGIWEDIYTSISQRHDLQSEPYQSYNKCTIGGTRLEEKKGHLDLESVRGNIAANLKSTLLTNRDATPKLLTDAGISGGAINESKGVVFTGATDAAGSTYRLVTMPSDGFVSSLSYYNTALGSGCVVDVAAWYPTSFQSGGGGFLAQSLTTTLISSSTFATALVGNTAHVDWTACMSTLGTTVPDGADFPIWQILGLSADPECNIDLGFTVRTAVATAPGVILG